mmetsp:Transcript_31108/g.103980  ORF Transcript_31108/g.103980 Transcript_31108/m.103980 type:complete len:262 (+) Transcript_31108:179-964(+)
MYASWAEVSSGERIRIGCAGSAMRVVAAPRRRTSTSNAERRTATQIFDVEPSACVSTTYGQPFSVSYISCTSPGRSPVCAKKSGRRNSRSSPSAARGSCTIRRKVECSAETTPLTTHPTLCCAQKAVSSPTAATYTPPACSSTDALVASSSVLKRVSREDSGSSGTCTSSSCATMSAGGASANRTTAGAASDAPNLRATSGACCGISLLRGGSSSHGGAGASGISRTYRQNASSWMDSSAAAICWRASTNSPKRWRRWARA